MGDLPPTYNSKYKPNVNSTEHEHFHVAEYSITCNLSDGREITLGVSPADKLYDLSQRLQSVIGYEPTAMKFLFAGAELCIANNVLLWPILKYFNRRSRRTIQYQHKGFGMERVLTLQQNDVDEQKDELGEELPSYTSLINMNGNGRQHHEQSLTPRGPFGKMGVHRSCQADNRITTWIIVFSISLIVTGLLYYITFTLKQRMSEQGDDPSALSMRYGCLTEMQSLVQTFMAIWLICGAAWVYGCSQDCRSDCDGLVYGLAFWTITITFSIIFMVICLIPTAVALITGLRCLQSRSNTRATLSASTNSIENSSNNISASGSRRGSVSSSNSNTTTNGSHMACSQRAQNHSESRSNVIGEGQAATRAPISLSSMTLV
eukprot:gene5032-123_t